MATIFHKKIKQVDYQIRQAGDSIRLYTDGVLHTQYHQSKHITGSVWDLLFLPSLLVNNDKPLRILVLGVGGGAILRMFDHFLNCSNITGIELNPNHIELAERFFKVKGQAFELVEADAIEWVKNYSVFEQKFDLIIDDLFYEEDGEPIKLVPPTSSWFYHLSSMLKPDGVVVMNFVGSKSAKQAAVLSNVDGAPKELVARFPYVLHLTTPFYDNHVLAMSAQEISPQQLKYKIQQHPELAKLKKELRYSVKSIMNIV